MTAIVSTDTGNLAFHNVAELVPAPGGGLHLARFPSARMALRQADAIEPLLQRAGL